MWPASMRPIVGQAIGYCLNLKLYSAVECRDAAIYLLGMTEEEAHTTLAIKDHGIWPAYLRVRAEHRSITTYTELLRGDAR